MINCFAATVTGTTTTLVTGDDIALAVQLKRNGAAFSIDVGATVKAALVSSSGTVTGPVVCSSSADGADWSTSLVVAEFESATTQAMAIGDYELEIEVDDNGRTTWFVQGFHVAADSID